ncbi:MAG: hypothetical protein ACRCX2_13415, partial [Paraclostridium sp.]
GFAFYLFEEEFPGPARKMSLYDIADMDNIAECIKNIETAIYIFKYIHVRDKNDNLVLSIFFDEVGLNLFMGNPNYEIYDGSDTYNFLANEESDMKNKAFEVIDKHKALENKNTPK